MLPTAHARRGTRNARESHQPPTTNHQPPTNSTYRNNYRNDAAATRPGSFQSAL